MKVVRYVRYLTNVKKNNKNYKVHWNTRSMTIFLLWHNIGYIICKYKQYNCVKQYLNVGYI